MKKILSILLALLMLLSASAALAENMGIQMIGGPDMETEPVSLDDVKLNVDIEIEGYGILTPTSFEYSDTLRYYKKGEHNTDYHQECYYSSGIEADYALFRMDITNTQINAADFTKSATVVVWYDDVYQYAGWVYQYNYNNVDNHGDRGGGDVRVINTEDNFVIDPMYEGHYLFGCTLPNAVVNGKKPLRIVITLDDNEITYNIRK